MTREIDERNTQRARLQSLDVERHDLEHALAEASRDAGSPEAPANAWQMVQSWFGTDVAGSGEPPSADIIERILARLGAIEFERATCRARLQHGANLELRYEAAIQQKHSELLDRAPDHPAVIAITVAFDALRSLQADVRELDETFQHASDALWDLDQLAKCLDNANAAGIADLFVSTQPLELALAVAKHASISEARGHGERASRSLSLLSQRLKHDLEAKRVAGPANSPGLSDFEVALIDALLQPSDGMIAFEISKWRNTTRALRERVSRIRSSLHGQRAQLERQVAEATSRYRLLITNV